jgi:hypothetical protein
MQMQLSGMMSIVVELAFRLKGHGLNSALVSKYYDHVQKRVNNGAIQDAQLDAKLDAKLDAFLIKLESMQLGKV